MTTKKPKVTYMGDEIDWDDPILGDTSKPVDNEHFFAPVIITPRAINEASKIVPKEHWEKDGGVHSFLEKRANYIFRKMPCVMTEAKFRSLLYIFEYSSDGPELKSVKLVQV